MSRVSEVQARLDRTKPKLHPDARANSAQIKKLANRWLILLAIEKSKPNKRITARAAWLVLGWYDLQRAARRDFYDSLSPEDRKKVKSGQYLGTQSIVKSMAPTQKTT